MTMDLIASLAGLAADSPVRVLLARREDIMDLTEKSRQAVLTPADPGGLSHTVRALIAVRAAERLGDPVLRDHYFDQFAHGEGAYDLADLVDPARRPDDPWLGAVFDHADRLTRQPRTARQSDIETLQRAGVSDADIVRLAELAAFLGYQARLISGLRLMEAAQ
jgi:uncharacterized protein YciW